MDRKCVTWSCAWAVAVMVAAALPQVVAAQDAPAADGEKPLAADARLGVSIGVANRNDAAFQLAEGLRFHLGVAAPRRDEGLYVGAELGQAFGNGFVDLRFSGRVGFDLGIDLHSPDLRLVVDPYATVGVGVVFPNGADAQAAFALGVGGEVKLDVGDTFYVLLRPIHFQFLIRDNTSVAYELLAGAGLRF